MPASQQSPCATSILIRSSGLTVLFFLLAIASIAQQWVELGPAPIGDYRTTGRVSAIAASPFDQNLYYVGGCDGGVWRSDDAGASWTPLTDQLPTTATGAVALDPNDDQVIYVGSGEANFANHCRYGLGLYKSIDGGSTWEVYGEDTFGGRCFSRILVDPDDTSVLYASITHAGGLPSFDFNMAGARGHPGALGPLGVWKSTDGGHTWAQLTNGVPGDLSATDMAMDPSDPQTLYAAIGHIFGDSRNGVYKSSDGGASWTKLTGGLPTSGVGRISLAVTPANPQRIYASIVHNCDSQGNGASTYSVYRSDDGGQTWVSKYPGSIHSSYGWYLNIITASPTDANVAFVAGLELYRTTNGGDSWSGVQGSQHVDFHAIGWDAAGRLLTGNDGGFYRSANLGATWTPLNEGLGLLQFYAGLSLDPTNSLTIYGGTQDNGTLKRTGPALDDWESLIGGDGGYTGVNQSSPNIVFGEYQGSGSLYRSTNYGGSFGYAGSGINSGDSNCFVSPYEFDPANPNHMYYATYRMYESTNGGTAWSPISGDLTGGGGAAIRGFAVAPSNSNTLYAGTNDGRVQVSFDAGRTWNLSLVDVPGWPRVMRQFAVDPDDDMRAYLAVSYFGEDQILGTADGGASWVPLDAGLPDVPVNTVALDPRYEPKTIYLGTDAGVWRSADEGTTWSLFGEGLPNCAVIDVRVDTANNRLVVATQGRGMWQLDLPERLAAPDQWLWPNWNWFSIPGVPVDGRPESVLGIDCKGRLFRFDKYLKSAQAYQPPFVEFDLSVADSYLLRLDEAPGPVAYDGYSPDLPYEFLLGRMGWTWVGKPALGEIPGTDFMANVRVRYPSDGSGEVRTAQQDYDATPNNWLSWGWAFWDAQAQAPKTFTPYSPFGNNICFPWVGYRVYINVGTAMDESDRDQVTLIWP
jgi:photosystem II stability/assembly factor-like uncharacterized protein